MRFQKVGNVAKAFPFMQLHVDISKQVRDVKDTVRQLWSGLLLGGQYVWSDARRSRKNVAIGVFTVVLVLSCVCLLQSAIARSPIIFIKVAENEVGEFDLLLTPKAQSSVPEQQGDGGPTDEVDDPYDDVSESEPIDQLTSSTHFWINQTDVQSRIENIPSCLGTAPRWTMLGRVYNSENLARNGTVIILVIDSEQEQRAGIGRDWTYRALNYEETYISSSALRQIGVQAAAGERVLVGFDFYTVAKTFGGLDADMVSKLLSAALEGALQNQTITIERQEFLESLGLGGVNWPPFFPPPLNGNNTSGTDDKGNGEDEIVINLGNIPNVTIDRVIHDYIEKHWDTIMDNFTPDKLSIECTVVDGVDDPHGKWPKSLGNVAILESRYLMRSVSHMIPDNPFFQDLLAQILGLRDPDDPHHYDLQKEVASVDLNAYALMVIAQYAGRFSTYQKSTEGMNLDLIEFTNEMVEALGVYYPVELTLPVQEILVGLNYLRMFLDQIFNAVLIILVGMGVMLIYSLLLSDVEDKTYEYGMLRALGLPHNALIELLLIQALFYAIPGITFGLIISQLLSAPIIYFMVQYSSVPASYLLQVDTIVLGCTLGILMPIISNIAPIQRALSRTLRDSLDVYHQTSQQIDVQMVKLETLGLDPWQIACALMMVFVGFLIYYVVPLAFIFLNVSLFLTILNGILLGMLLGATIVATLFQPILERQILKLLLWGRDRKLEILIQKSLAGHRIRNRKTALMYSICLAFIIFAGAMFTLQATALNDNVKAGIGSDINIISAMIKNPLPEENMRLFLEEQLRVPEPDRIVEMYSFLTFSMWDMHDVRSNYVTNLADFPWHRLNVYGADKDYLNSVYGEYYIPSEWDKSFDYQGVNDDHSKPDIIRSLYTDAGQQVLTIEKSKEEGGLGVGIPPQITSSQSVGVREGQTSFYFRGNEETYTQYIDAICSEALRYASFLDTDTAVKMDVSARYIENYSVTLKYLVKMRAMVTKMSGFFFSSYRQTAFGSPLIVSMDQYQSIVDDIYSIKRHGYLQLGHTTEEADELVGEVPSTPPKQRLFIRIKAKSTLAERELVMNGLRNFLQDSTTVVLDTTDLLATTEVATWALLLFFDLIAAISCSMCFFVLWLSFTSNIKENSWEFGVLRAVGLSAAQVTRVYIYEALAIILSALVLGSFTGITVAVTLTLQFNLFVEMPFHFQFPYTLFVSVLIMSIVVAIGGSYLASRDIKRKQIAQVLKGSL